MSLRPAVLFFSLLAPLLASGVTAPTAQDAGENQFDANITLFSVMAAINAAGFDAGIKAPINARFQVRDQVRAELAKRTIPCLPELKAFYLQHKKPTETADLSQYISFALLADGPPDFPIHSVDLPGGCGGFARIRRVAGTLLQGSQSGGALESFAAGIQPGLG